MPVRVEDRRAGLQELQVRLQDLGPLPPQSELTRWLVANKVGSQLRGTENIMPGIQDDAVRAEQGYRASLTWRAEQGVDNFLAWTPPPVLQKVILSRPLHFHLFTPSSTPAGLLGSTRWDDRCGLSRSARRTCGGCWAGPARSSSSSLLLR